MALLATALLTDLATPSELASDISTVTSTAPRHSGDTRVFSSSDGTDVSLWRAFGTTSSDWKCLFSRRTGSSNPTGSVTPRCYGELFIDTVLLDVYISTGVASGDWKLLTGTGGGGGGS